MTFAKIGTGPQERIVLLSSKHSLHLGNLMKDVQVRWKRPGRNQPHNLGIFRGFAGDGIMLECLENDVPKTSRKAYL